MSPLLSTGNAVDWWFAFKFNAATYTCVEQNEPGHALFGGRPKNYPEKFCLQYACASSADPTLKFGGNQYLGTSLADPLGATFNQVYNGDCNYVLWNDQFYGSPIATEASPWGHSKGLLAWDGDGNGFVLQVSSPSWPASGNVRSPRVNDGNTLGCVTDDDVEVSQHFFALKVNADDVAAILQGLANSSVVTKQGVPQIMNVTAKCPANLKQLVAGLGVKSKNKTVFRQMLSSGVAFISKPSNLNVPPWQMVSAELGSVPLRVASWWDKPTIPSTIGGTDCGCWNTDLGTADAVEIATSGTWEGKSIGLTGGDGPNFNHAKIGVSTDPARPFCIFGDLNQQGTLDGVQGEKVPCASSQNGRGGTFYMIQHAELHKSMTDLLTGSSAPTS